MRHIDAIKIYEKHRCLIVDDMAQVRADLKRMLRTFGLATVDTVATAPQVINACSNVDYDLVLCDYNLGDGQDGQQVLEELRFRKLLKNTSLFLMITAETSRDMVLGALEYLPDDYLSKPITTQLLQTRMNRIVERHEDLRPIKEQLDNNDIPAAITACNERLGNKGRYTSSYLRMKAELLCRIGRYAEATEIYQRSLEASNPIWAHLGLGKSYMAQEMFDEAEQQLKTVTSSDTRYVEAHDMLADIYAQQGKFEASQGAMEAAIAVSPKSVLRQRRLATMAKQNQDADTSLKARKETLKFAEHSCHYTPQDYFDMCSELLADALNRDEKEQRQHEKRIDGYLKRAVRKHPADKSIRLQSKAARSKLLMSQGREDQAQAMLKEAVELAEQENCSALAELELADTLSRSGDKEGSMALLLKLARENPNDEGLADRIDAISDEPISQKGKKLAEKLTKQGISFFEEKSYDAAIDVFHRATSLFPNHIGLRLNIAHVAVSKGIKLGASEELYQLCKNNLEQVGTLPANHKQYARRQRIEEEMNKLFSNA